MSVPLSRCESCGRRAKVSRHSGDEARCEFCGGILRQVWGLAQLGQRPRADGGAGSPQLYENQAREALYGPPDETRTGQSDEPDRGTENVRAQSGGPGRRES